MRTVGHYLDYMAEMFGLDGRDKIGTKNTRLFKKFINAAIENWELKGDMDYLKKLGMLKTKAAVSGTVTANKGISSVTLTIDPGFEAVGCDLQINEKVYTITQYTSSGVYEIFPAFLDANTTTDTYVVRFNRFPTPPYFKKVLHRQMMYLTSLSQRHFIEERDFATIPVDNDTSDPAYFQIKHSAREHGFEGTASAVTNATVTCTAVLSSMANLPVMFEGVDEVYYIRSVTDGTHFVLDRDITTAITASTAFFVIPYGTMFFEVYPHPTEAKQIIFDYLESESEKNSVNELIHAPKAVLELALDLRIAKFAKDPVSAQTLIGENLREVTEAAKMKTVTDYSPSIKFLGSNRDSDRYLDSDYGRSPHRRRRSPYGRRS